MALPEPAVRFGVVVAAAILWVAKGYVLSVYRGEKKFKVTMAGKTLALGVVGGGIAFALGNGTSGEALAMALTFAVPLVDNLWNRFSSTWTAVEQHNTVEQFEKAANELVNEHGDEAAEKMDQARKDLTGKSPTDTPLSGLGDAAVSASEATGDLGKSMENAEPSSAEDQDWPPSVTTPDEKVNEKVDAVKNTRRGYQKLRAVAAIIPSVNGLGTRIEIETALREYEDPLAVLDAFATVEARERGERQAESGGESA